MWFKNKAFQRDEELQAELRALVDVVELKGSITFNDVDRYERLLKEIYKRGLEPAVKIKGIK